MSHLDEILPGIYHWTAVHPNIGIEVSSYWLENGGVLIDPLVPPDGELDWFADGVVKGGPHGATDLFGFVPDSLLDDPPETKQALLDSFARLLSELDFDHVLLAHGGPVIGDGRAKLQELVDSGGRTAFEF